MSTNRELVRSVYEALGRGDVGPLLGALDPEVVWLEADNYAYADRNPYIGPQQVAEGVLARFGNDWDVTLGAERFLQDGDTVVALGRCRGMFRATGRPVDAQFVHVWTVHEGRVTRFEQYLDTLQFARVMDRGGAPVAEPAAAPGMPGASSPAPTVSPA
jgi:uncharacterized protein